MQLSLKRIRGRANRPPTASSPVSRPVRPCRGVVLVGAHGGAGVSTFQVLLGGAWDMGVVRSLDAPRGPIHSGGKPLVVVCRATVPAARRATEAVNAILRGGQPVDALVVVADGAGPVPADARARFRLLADRVGGTVHVPFCAGLRLADDPATVRLPERMRRAIEAIRELTDDTTGAGAESAESAAELTSNPADEHHDDRADDRIDATA